MTASDLAFFAKKRKNKFSIMNNLSRHIYWAKNLYDQILNREYFIYIVLEFSPIIYYNYEITNHFIVNSKK